MASDVMEICRVCSHQVDGPPAGSHVRWVTCVKCTPIQRTHFDPARAVAITDAEREVVEAAEAFGVDPWRGDLEGTVVGVSMEYDANGTYVLYEDVLPIIEAVRALRTARGDA